MNRLSQSILAVAMLAFAGAAMAQPAVAPSPPTGAPTAPAAPAPRPPAAVPQAELIDINSATLDQLQTLRGIGPARAQAIVAGRPYRAKDDLTRRNIIPESVYNDIQARIVARQQR